MTKKGQKSSLRIPSAKSITEEACKAHVLNTIVMIPSSAPQKQSKPYNSQRHTTCRPRFSTLLELQEHVLTVVIVVEVVNIVDDEDKRFPCLLGVFQGDFLDLV